MNSGWLDNISLVIILYFLYFHISLQLHVIRRFTYVASIPKKPHSQPLELMTFQVDTWHFDQLATGGRGVTKFGPRGNPSSDLGNLLLPMGPQNHEK